MHELTLHEIQQESLKVLLKLDALCRELNIRYFLAFGTLIGAIRHNGFIPWDDDIDVMMLRKDYQILKNYMDAHADEMRPFRICDRANTKNYSASIPRFVNTDFTFRTRNPGEKQFTLGVFVDIYPLDFYGKSEKVARRLKRRTMFLDRLYIISINPSNGKKSVKNLMRILASGIAKAYLSLHNIKKIGMDTYLYNLIQKRTSESDPLIGVVAGDTSGGYFSLPSDFFNGVIEHEFEGHPLMIPARYDEYLKKYYGDYMKIPPESERVPHHSYSIYRNDTMTSVILGGGN